MALIINVANAIKFIIVNQLHKNITIATLRITELTIPSIEPNKYIGTNIHVAGSNTVYVKTALAPTSNTVSNVSHQKASGDKRYDSLKKSTTVFIALI